MAVRLAHLLASCLALAALGGCASGPLSEEGVDRNLTPGDVRAAGDTAKGKTVLWGGEIVSSRNLPERTRIEVVAYPLAHFQRPNTDAAPMARFRAYQDGYLETAAYARGRQVTLRGEVTGTETGKVDDIDYTFPTVDIEAIELWQPERSVERNEPRFHFGFGVIQRY